MNLQAVWPALEASPVGDFVASSAWAFPTIESVHVISIVTVVGTVGIMDLRLLGLASGAWTAPEMSRDTLRWTWVAFVAATITGALLFVSKAHIYAIEPWFLAKMVLIALAGLNMVIFHVFTWHSAGEWKLGSPSPMAARIAGGLSLALWLVAIFCGRWVGFTLGKYE
jgi:hypothetical protein